MISININALWFKILGMSVDIPDIFAMQAFFTIQVDQVSPTVPSVTCPKRYLLHIILDNATITHTPHAYTYLPDRIR